jgi:hypothetical protein
MLLVFITFMSIFLYLFYRSFKIAKTYDLVVEDYYEAELNYPEFLKKKNAADTMHIPVKIFVSEKDLHIQFPPYINRKQINGEVTLFRPDNKKFDKKIPIRLDTTNLQIIPSDSLLYGNWKIILDWKIDSTEYYKEEKIYYNH